MPFEKDGVSHVDEQELQQLLEEGKDDTFFIDVREPHEYAAGHIPGVPLVPMNTIPDQLQELDKDAEYVVICRSGGRSLNVAKYMLNQGFANVHNFDGGMLKWNGEFASGLEHVPEKADSKSLRRKL